MLIDTNLIAVFFNKNNERHGIYKPVLEWFMTGKAKIVTGGGRYYQREIKERLVSYVPILTELSRLNKTHWFPDKDVDELVTHIESLESDSDFDDPHIVALLCISKAKIFCSEDERAFKFVKDKKFYPKGQETPKVLSLKTHAASLELLNDENICTNGVHLALPMTIARKFMEKVS
jgi:predicted nucleic acid-binding protein